MYSCGNLGMGWWQRFLHPRFITSPCRRPAPNLALEFVVAIGEHYRAMESWEAKGKLTPMGSVERTPAFCPSTA